MFLNYINNLRGLVIIFIVGFHSFWLIDWDINSLMYDVVYSFFKGSSAYFLFIAGFLFQHLLKSYQYQNYLKKKFQYVILPYLLVSIPAIVKMVFFTTDGIFKAYPHYLQAPLYYLSGLHVSPFWFIPMIVLFYLCSPVFAYFDKKRGFYWVLPVLILLSQVVLRSRGLAFGEVDSLLRVLLAPLQSFVHFLSIYIFGMFCSHHKQSLFIYLQRYIAWIVLAFFGLFSLELFIEGHISYFEQNVNYFKSLVFLLLILYIFQRYDVFLGKKLALIGEMSFGIFFLHEYVNWVVWKAEKFLFGGVMAGTLFNYLLILAISLGICMLLLGITKRLFGRNSRLLVGY
jgi:hypothetical protein